MSGAPESLDAARLERALQRLLGHCQLVGRMTADAQRIEARQRLETELGPELTHELVAGLSSAAA